MVGKISWRRKWQPTLVLLPGKSHGQRSLVGYSPWGHKESDTAEWLYFTKHCISLSSTFHVYMHSIPHFFHSPQAVPHLNWEFTNGSLKPRTSSRIVLTIVFLLFHHGKLWNFMEMVYLSSYNISPARLGLILNFLGFQFINLFFPISEFSEKLIQLLTGHFCLYLMTYLPPQWLQKDICRNKVFSFLIYKENFQKFDSHIL